jgi:hypothetical protein
MSTNEAAVMAPLNPGTPSAEVEIDVALVHTLLAQSKLTKRLTRRNQGGGLISRARPSSSERGSTARGSVETRKRRFSEHRPAAP